ncbi:amino acid synthesis family protein [Mycoplana dimorpha]|uniref:Amino acid synthesis protein n=1 Tax=Mycoplana dimorpha TaxID=28320 RepID=A0A2T5BAW7_MYCDI|nr:amino acid synthesis family protein [Mycoplana dimorpha]PTM96128.1 amino acid synthesis protein [Mycoplana dimorpha]
MPFEIRKIVTVKETTFQEGERVVTTPVTMLAVAAIIRNPWHGRGYVHDLSVEQKDGCAQLGQQMVDIILEEIGGAERIEAYGKAAVVGMDGEIEHASAVIHNLRFGNKYRDAVKAESYLTFTNKRGGPGTSIQMPLKHLHDAAARSHFLTMEIILPEAPAPHEIVVVLGASTGGRPHARIQDRNFDAAELAAEQAAAPV